jgi:FKBP-type peptidyl-prolyl cis-trans isomerase
VRKSAALLVALGLVISLAACAPAATTTGAGNSSGCVAGTASTSVKVAGKFGALPTVTVKPGLTSKNTQTTVLTKGTGKAIKTGDRVNVEFSVYNGTTGKELTSTGFNKRPVAFTVDKTKTPPGLVKALSCSTIGSRLVVVVPPADAFGSAGSTDLGVGAKDTIVFVADLTSLAAPVLKRAAGAAVAPKAGLPTVKLDASGAPTVTIPKGAKPAKIQIETLIKGTGAVVPASSQVTVNYQGTIWSTGKVFDSSWASGTPASLSTDGVVKGFAQAIVGQTVGSQVLVVIPPSLGYGKAGNKAIGLTGTDDMVFVIDILGIG